MTSPGQGNWGKWLLERVGRYSSRLKPAMLKSASEKQRKLEAPSFEGWPNGLWVGFLHSLPVQGVFSFERVAKQ